jgi:hypothetical protein
MADFEDFDGEDGCEGRLVKAEPNTHGEAFATGPVTPEFLASEFLAEVRELRCRERAPEAVSERVLQKLQHAVQASDPGKLAALRPSLGQKAWFDMARDRPPIHRHLPGLLGPASRPLLGRLAGATLLLGVVVVAFGDARRTVDHREAARPAPVRPNASGEPASLAQAVPPLPDFRDEPKYPHDVWVVGRGDVAAPETHNLVTNGDFSQGELLWSVRELKESGDLSSLADFAVRDGALCSRLRVGEYVLGGWPWEDRRLSPSSFELVKGQRYRLSLRAWSLGSESVELIVKIGHQRPPYAAAFVAAVPIEVAPRRFDVEFVARAADHLAGFAFVATGRSGERSELCLDDVSVMIAE